MCGSCWLLFARWKPVGWFSILTVRPPTLCDTGGEFVLGVLGGDRYHFRISIGSFAKLPFLKSFDEPLRLPRRCNNTTRQKQRGKARIASV
ncbi:hypothetical protein F5Y09DRAFT_202459 [Xylaria sp. FL1042]|nr:hypothetical protein F5Y09DRAFT_202459 [Xylaria sp. FL1042]